MDRHETFRNYIKDGYTFKGDSIILGTAILDNEALPETHVKIPLKTLNRHGLIAGATGTGKTKTVQLFAESLSDKSIPVLLMDIKGDLSGIAAPGETGSKIKERHDKIGIPHNPAGYPVEFLTLSDEKGARLRATVSEFGPVLLSKILELNDAQSGIISLIFKYCDDNNLPLLDLNDLKKTVQYITDEGKEEIEKEYGRVSTASTGTILRRIIELEQQGADRFFGEESFDVKDLTRIDKNGRGIISIIRLVDIQDRPKLFSTFMLCLLSEIYQTFPEKGDSDQPELVIVIDEAHLIFRESSKALLDQIETVIKLIRSKGVGIYFCTQNPSDVPASVLGQLGLKIQHALRAFTALDRKMIKLTAQNYPLSDYYKTEELLTSLGIGEAAVTVLNEKGNPTPLAAVLLCAPASRMDILSDDEIDEVIKKSKIADKYNREIDRESAYEILTKRIESLDNAAEAEVGKSSAKPSGRARKEKSTAEKILGSTVARQVGRTVAREITRGLLGVLGLRK